MGGQFSEAERNLAALIKWTAEHDYAGRRNEAATRLQLIDRVLFECLGWDRADCEPENHQAGEFADYVLSAPHQLLVVEAKREGIYFELPAGENRHVYDLRFFEKHNPQVFKAVEQCVGYCARRGIKFGVVSNGHQYVAFLGSRTDGKPPLSGRALAYSSLEDIQSRFLEFWNHLGHGGVQAHNLVALLQEGDATPPPEKLSRRIVGYPGYKNRNDLQTNLQILGDIVIEDVARSTDEEEFLRECYCAAGALSQYALISKKILKARYSVLFEKAAGGPSLKPAGGSESISAAASVLTRRPLLLLGDVGVGKTMFVRHFIKIDAAQVMRRAIVIYVDFGVKPTIAGDLRPYLAAEVKRQLVEVHGVDIDEDGFVRGVYFGDLRRFEGGIYGALKKSDPAAYQQKQIEHLAQRMADVEEHLRLSLEHVAKARKQQIVVFLDNIDQRPYDFQQEVFLIGQSIAERWPVAAFVSLRPETFYRSKSSGALSAYHPQAFTIAPPRVELVVLRRLGYSLQLLKRGALPSLSGVTFQLQSLTEYLGIIEHSFQSSRQLMEFLENVCGGNVRLALDFLRMFIGSGHVNTRNALEKFATHGSYSIPIHEFLRAVIHGDHEHFDPRKSTIVNVFDVSAPDGREHFLLCVILAQMDRWSQTSTLGGFVSPGIVVEFCQNIGFQYGQIEYALKRAFTAKLIEVPTKQAEAGESDHFRITTVGGYYYKRLVAYFAYVDAMIVDTPIVDPGVRAVMGEAEDIWKRLERVERLVAYLDEQWRALSNQELAFSWDPVAKAVRDEVARIRAGLRKRGLAAGGDTRGGGASRRSRK